MAVVNSQLLSPAQVADRSGMSVKTIYRAIHRGDLAASRLGSRLRVNACDFDAWVAAARVAPAAAALPRPRTPARPVGGAGSDDALLRIEAEAA